MLDNHRRERTSKRSQTAPLAGKLFLADGRRLTPTHSRGARGNTYRYYAPASCQTGRAVQPEIRLPARRFEAQLRSLLQRIVPDGAMLSSIATRIELHPHQLLIDLPASMREAVRRTLAVR